MGKVVVMSSMSLDGFIERPGRDISWHRIDDELHRHLNEVLARAGAFLSGRVTHELMADFWPTADADPANAGPMAEFAAIWRDKTKIVFSRTLARADWNTTVRRDVDPDEIARLRAEPGGDLVVGGANLAATFLRLGLVDEYRVYVHPVVVGGGTPLFPAGAALDLGLVESRVFGNGVALLRYAVDAPGAAAA